MGQNTLIMYNQMERNGLPLVSRQAKRVQGLGSNQRFRLRSAEFGVKVRVAEIRVACLGEIQGLRGIQLIM